MKLENWGLVPYEEATRRQLEALEAVSEGAEERLILCTHPPVVTLGRGTPPGDVDGWTGEIIETSRGGRATYHGPSQLVIYPIVDLRQGRDAVPQKDVGAYLRAVEQATVLGLKSIGLMKAEARTTRVGEQSLTGVWIGEKKITSIGVAVKKWITYHGVAINVLKDERAFQGIRPCGFSRDIMTSIEEQIGAVPEARVYTWMIAKSFLSLLEP